MNFTIDYYQARDIINKVLFKLDPMSTGCKENELEDEYYEVATRISYNWFSDSFTLYDAVKFVFYENFWEDALSNFQVMSISNAIMKEMSK